MKPQDFHDMNRQWLAHNFVVDMVHRWYDKNGDLYIIDLNSDSSTLFGTAVSKLGWYGKKKVENLFKIHFARINHKVRYV